MLFVIDRYNGVQKPFKKRGIFRKAIIVGKIKLVFLLFIAAMLTLSSCSYRMFDFTVISSKNVSLKIDKTQGIKVSASSNGFLGFGADIKEALDKALQSAGPDYDLIVDGVVKGNYYFFVSGYKVEGTAFSTSKLKAELGEQGFEDWYKANNVFDPSTAIVNK